MKRKTIMKLGALTLAMTMVFGSTMSVSAANGIGFDLTDRGDNGGRDENTVDNWEDGWSWMDQQNDSNSGNDNSSNTGSTGNESSGNNGGSGSTSNTSTPSEATSAGSTATAGSTAGKTIKIQNKNSKATIPGYETFLQNGSGDEGVYKVTHCGQDKAALGLKDKDGNKAAFTGIELSQMADGRYALAITTADPEMTYTVETILGDATYLPKLGLMAVTVNGTLVRDLQAEADAAAQAAAEAAVTAK